MPDLIITLTAPQAVRVAAAVGRVLRSKAEDGTPRAATLPEVRAFLVRHLRTIVFEAAAGQARADAALEAETLGLE